MTEETPAKRGHAAWKAETEAVARRNADAHSRALSEKKARSATAAAAERVELDAESRRLQALNERMDKQRARANR